MQVEWTPMWFQIMECKAKPGRLRHRSLKQCQAGTLKSARVGGMSRRTSKVYQIGHRVPHATFCAMNTMGACVCAGVSVNGFAVFSDCVLLTLPDRRRGSG